jgi:hypothetical protein
MKLITSLLLATAFAAHANWFTELFEDQYDKQIREAQEQSKSARDLTELRDFLQDEQQKWDVEYQQWKSRHFNCTISKCLTPDKMGCSKF